MKYLSVCSGIEAATVAWHPLGWEPVAFSEIEKFPSAVLNHHYPDVPNEGDFTTIGDKYDLTNGLLVGGTPCQSFSIAGLRKGMDDERGNLALEFLKLARHSRAQWVAWENVPRRALVRTRGRDFWSHPREGWQNSGMGGHTESWTLSTSEWPKDADVCFVVGCLGSWQRAAAVLFEQASLSGHTPPSREKREGLAKGFETSPGGGRFTDVAPTMDCRAKDGPIRNQLGVGAIVPHVCGRRMTAFGEYEDETASSMKARDYKDATDLVCEPMVQSGALGIPGNWIGCKPENGGNAVAPMDNLSPNLTSTDKHAVCFTQNQCGDVLTGNISPSMGTNSNASGRNTPKALIKTQVRRLTPVECERLQGFPDNYTRIPWRGKPEEDCPDGPRYKALGNSMAVPVMRWIGERINKVESQRNST